MTKSSSNHQDTLNLLLSGARRRRLRDLILFVVMIFLLFWYTKGLYLEETDWQRIGSLREIFNTFLEYFPPDVTILPNLIVPTTETLMIAFLGTLLAVLFSLPTTWLSARNITPLFPVSYSIGRLLIIVSRSVHEIVWALFFVAAFGLGPLPGIIAIAFRSFGFLSKLTAETIEDLDPRSIEGVKATGANRWQIIYFGILPQVLPVFVGNLYFLWDINIRRSTLAGMVGAGGLGLAFRDQMFKFNYSGATTVLLVIIVMVAAGEIFSLLTRKAIIKI